MQTDLTECRAGNHNLVAIFEQGNDLETKVVRWCRVCGSIAIDVDFDGRTHPGRVMEMTKPKILESL